MPVLSYLCLLFAQKNRETNMDSSPRSWIIKMPITKKIEEKYVNGRHCTLLTIFVCGWFYLRDSCAGILEQPMGA
jgi:hypothetical protein